MPHSDETAARRNAEEEPLSPGAARPEVTAARRIVIKVGTRVLTHDDGRLALTHLFSIVEAIGSLRRQAKEVLLVSSGAVGLGAEALKLAEIPTDTVTRQVCAAVGQTRLVDLYEEGLSHLGLVCGQILVTQADFVDRGRYLNLRATLQALLAHGVVPVINENDAVSTEEIALFEGNGRRVFGDNDRLSALVASKLTADLLVLLTDVEGVYDRDPRTEAGADLIHRLDLDQPWVEAGGAGSAAGRGGMRSKMEAARIAASAGCHVVIATGRRPGLLASILAGDDVGTWVPARPGMTAHERWLAYATAPRGALHLDAGAVTALVERNASLLAAGVTRIDGSFRRGDVVELRGADGGLLGRGRVHCDADTARAWIGGLDTDRRGGRHALVRRDQMVLERG